MSEFQSSGIVNDRERPRILQWVLEPELNERLSWAKGRSGTFRRILNPQEVDLSEWDVLITDQPHATIGVDKWGIVNPGKWDRLPQHLNIFRIFSESSANAGHSYLEFNVNSYEAQLNHALRIRGHVAGSRMHSVSGLPEPIKDLVKSTLLPAVEARPSQFGIIAAGTLEPAGFGLRPFLLGPPELIMAASYSVPGGASIWILPRDVLEIEAWFDAAITEWHTRDRHTFPNINTWQTNPTWATVLERTALSKLATIEADFEVVSAEYETTRADAILKLDSARTSALNGPKALLTGQDKELELATLEALTRLGFEVKDMDQIWSSRERREDFRITDPDVPDWLAIADATGVAKGAPGAKIVTVTGYVTKYVLEESPSATPGIWIIINRLFHRDPMTRGDIYRADDLAVLEDQKGLAIDSAALYLLDQSIEPGSDRARECRTWLRQSLGQITAQDAHDWLSEDLAASL